MCRKNALLDTGAMVSNENFTYNNKENNAMKLERIAYLFFVAFLVLFAASQAKSDIVVFKSGNYRECSGSYQDQCRFYLKND